MGRANGHERVNTFKNTPNCVRPGTFGIGPPNHHSRFAEASVDASFVFVHLLILAPIVLIAEYRATRLFFLCHKFYSLVEAIVRQVVKPTYDTIIQDDRTTQASMAAVWQQSQQVSRPLSIVLQYHGVGMHESDMTCRA